MSPAKRPKKTQTAIRLPDDLLDRLDRLAAKMSKTTGIEVTRSDVVRTCIARGLEVEEKRHG